MFIYDKKGIFTEGYNKYYASAISKAIRYCKSESDAEDIVHNAFVKAWEKYDTLNDKNKFIGWYMAILKNEIIGFHREKVRYSTVYYDDTDYITHERLLNNITAEIGFDEVHTFLLRSDINIIINHVNSYSKPQRDVFKLRFIAGFKIQEVAEILEITEGSIKKQISNIREQLKSYLETDKY